MRADRRFGSSTLGAALAAGAMLCVPAVGAAQARTYVVAVPTSDAVQIDAARAASGARSALGSIEGIEWRAADRTFVGYDDTVMERLDRARARFEQGRTAFQEVDLDLAIEALTGSVDDFDAAAPAIDDPSEMGTALLYLGAAYDVAGRARDATRVFGRVHVQMPWLEPDADEFNPDVVAHFQAAAPRDRSETGTIRMESDPPGGLAVVDFLARGGTPTDAAGLRNGTHVVRVTRPGSTPYVQPVEVRRGSASSVNAMLVENEESAGLADAIAGLQEADMNSLGRSGPLFETARILGLDKLGVVRVTAAGAESVTLELLVFDVRSGRRVLRAQGTTPTDRGRVERAARALVAQGIARALNARVTPDTRISGGVVGGGGETGGGFIPSVGGGGRRDTGGESIVTKWWFWTAIGAVVLTGVIIGVAVASSGGNDLGADPSGQVILEF